MDAPSAGPQLVQEDYTGRGTAISVRVRWDRPDDETDLVVGVLEEEEQALVKVLGTLLSTHELELVRKVRGKCQLQAGLSDSDFCD